MRKGLLVLTTAIAVAISGLNAMDETTEMYPSDVQSRTVTKFVSNRDSIIQKLLSEFRSALEIKRSDLKYDLEAISKYYDTGYNFGDEHSNHESLYNWVVYTRSLHALHKLGNSESGLKLQEELDRAKRRLEIIDFYTDGKDYRYCLSGMWSIVSIFDAEERDKFLRTTEEEIPKSQSVIGMVRDFQFDYK